MQKKQQCTSPNDCWKETTHDANNDNWKRNNNRTSPNDALKKKQQSHGHQTIIVSFSTINCTSCIVFLFQLTFARRTFVVQWITFNYVVGVVHCFFFNYWRLFTCIVVIFNYVNWKRNNNALLFLFQLSLLASWNIVSSQLLDYVWNMQCCFFFNYWRCLQQCIVVHQLRLLIVVETTCVVSFSIIDVCLHALLFHQLRLLSFGDNALLFLFQLSLWWHLHCSPITLIDRLVSCNVVSFSIIVEKETTHGTLCSWSIIFTTWRQQRCFFFNYCTSPNIVVSVHNYLYYVWCIVVSFSIIDVVYNNALFTNYFNWSFGVVQCCFFFNYWRCLQCVRCFIISIIVWWRCFNCYLHLLFKRLLIMCVMQCCFFFNSRLKKLFTLLFHNYDYWKRNVVHCFFFNCCLVKRAFVVHQLL